MTDIRGAIRPVLYRDAVWFWVVPIVLAVGLLPLTTSTYQRIPIATILVLAVIAGVVTGVLAKWRPGWPVRVHKDFRSSFPTTLVGMLIMYGCGIVVAPDSHSFWAKLAGYCAGFALSIPAVVWIGAYRARRARREP